MANKFTFKDGTMVYLFAILASIGLQTVLVIILQLFGAESILQIDWVNILFSFVIECAFVGVVIAYCMVKHTRFSLEAKPVKTMGYIWPIVTAVVCIVGFYLIALAFQLTLAEIHYESGSSLELDSLPAKILGIFVTVIAAPIGEELVFRGALLSGLTEKFKAPAAIALSALAFSLMHMNPEQTVYQFLLGAACACFALQSGSVIPSMILHGASNLIVCLIDIIAPLEAWLKGVLEALVAMPGLFALLTVVLLAAGLAAVYFIGRALAKCKSEEKERSFTAKPPVHCVDNETETPPPNILKSGGVKPAVLYAIGIIASFVMWASVFVTSILTGLGIVG